MMQGVVDVFDEFHDIDIMRGNGTVVGSQKYVNKKREI